MATEKASDAALFAMRLRGGAWAAYRGDGGDMRYLKIGGGSAYAKPPPIFPATGATNRYVGMVNVYTGEVYGLSAP